MSEGTDGDPHAPLWIIGRDYGEAEEREQRPFVGKAGQMLDKLLRRVGLDRADAYIDNVIRARPPGNVWGAHPASAYLTGPTQLADLITQHQPKLIVACGNEAFRVSVGGTLKGDLPGIQDARGYLWESTLGPRVLPIIHPAGILREWVPWRILTQWDLAKAKREIDAGYPELAQRHTNIITQQHELPPLWASLTNASLVALDIENSEDLRLACLGVATSETEAYVIPAQREWQMAAIRTICESMVPKVFQNGMYDRYFLRRICEIETRNVVFDTMLAWHALFPELAGMREDAGTRKRMRRKTQKGLRFLASIYTRDAFWKDYDFLNETERYELCGKDCCITLEIAHAQQEQLT
jgi:DNA polymerase